MRGRRPRRPRDPGAPQPAYQPPSVGRRRVITAKHPPSPALRFTLRYEYYGSEQLYSGLTGVKLKASIFIGVVQYQRLRHMVSDKAQVRATGPLHNLTRQPVKGRKRHGGVRFGEMERDSLIAHGTSYLLQDRLMNCSDKHIAYVCAKCGSLLGPSHTPQTVVSTSHTAALEQGSGAGGLSHTVVCRACKGKCEPTSLPYVFRYLVNEMAAMGLDCRLGLADPSTKIRR